jgi:topoisomerase-4 subunit A
VYFDGKTGVSYVKRFKVTSITRDREYRIVSQDNKSKITYFSANENGEAEIISINLTANCTAKNKQFDYDFAKLAIKGRESLGNVLTKYPVRKIIQKSAGVSTLGGVDIWYDPTIGRLNRDQHGDYVGNFEPTDHILVIYNAGNYELTNFELTNRYPAEEIALLVKFNPKGIISAVYLDGANKTYFIKRFKIETSTIDKKFLFISDHKVSKLVASTVNYAPNVQIKHKPDGKTSEMELIPIDELVDVRGWKAIGSKLNYPKLTDVQFLETETSMPESEAIVNATDEVIEESEIDSEEVVEVETESLNAGDIITVPVETLSKGQKIILEDEVSEPKSNEQTDDIPLEIKNYTEENIPKESSTGEQLGLF